jgi:tetratricopeptide (TPR) repeat protein
MMTTFWHLIRPAGAHFRSRATPVLAAACLSLALPQAPAQTPEPADAGAPTEAGAVAQTDAATVGEAATGAAANGAAEEVEPAELPPTTRFEAKIEFDRLMSERSFDEAVDIGQIMLELTFAEFGEDSPEAAVAHNSLAEAQRRAGQFDDAELHYLRAIDIYRALDGPFAPAAITPTIGLGDNYYDEDEFVNSVSAYNEARSVQRRSFGLLSEDQILVLDRLTRSYQAMRLGDDANEQQLSALALIERNHPAGSVEVLAGIYKYARWLRSVGRYFDERAQYERAIRVIRDTYGKDHPLMITPYREIGNSFRDQAFEDPRGVGSLNTALEIIEEQEAIDPLVFAETLRDVGDWKTAFSPIGAGHADYERAWELLASIENGSELRDEWFGGRQPRFVVYQRLSPRDLSADPLDPDAVDGHVLLQFDVDVDGRPDRIVIIESDPVGFKDEAAVRSIRQSRFRPYIDSDGNFVPVSGLAIQISFRYVPDDGT